MGRLGLTEALLVLALLFLVFAEYFIAFVARRVLRPKKRLEATRDLPDVAPSAEDGPVRAAIKEETGP
jgi:hypothetical protein